MLNSFSGVGFVGTDPKQLQTATGTTYYKFILCIQREKNGQDGKPAFDRIPCAAWSKAAETVRFCEKGDFLSIGGKIQTSAYQQNGAWVNSWEIYINSVSVIQKAGTMAARPPMPQQQPQPMQPPQAIAPQPMPPQQPPAMPDYMQQDPANLPFSLY